MVHHFAMHHRRLAAGLLLFLGGLVLLGQLASGSASAEPPQTGPETEKRFPPLVVPADFKATLFACDPLIEYPSAIAVGPKEKPGSLLVAIDYMTGLGTEIVRRDEIRLIEDTDGDGYADKATLYADGFNSIMGLTQHGGSVYVMHAPFLTSLRDADGDGKADERRDLLSGLGLPPEKNDVRLHCANGVVMGHDGWLYLALGDHGCDVPRPEGDRLVYHGGGILRCRPDGRDLHVFASGLRNIYDVALDDDLNVFVRDNENDGGDYKIRVCYSFHGADHGYPYLYYERPDEALPPLADLGLGSSAGGAAYLERQFPAEYSGSLFFCEWGKSVVNYRPQRTGSGFAPLAEIQFAAGADNDPYGFKPTDLVVDRDGSLVVADWCDGQRPKRGRGRIYRITYRGAGIQPAQRQSPVGAALQSHNELISRLNSDSHFDRFAAQDAISSRGPEGIKALQDAMAATQGLSVRARMHAVWILTKDGSDAAREKLFDLVASDPDPRVQVQGVRALADLYDPVLAGHRLDAPPADPAIAERLAKLALGKDPRVLLEIVIAVGRLQWREAPDWLRKTLAGERNIEPVLAHAAMQTLRHSGNWPLVLLMLDLPHDALIRPIALRAIAGQHHPAIADGLIERLEGKDVQRRIEYAGALTRICRQPGPWTYWGYRPPPRPASNVAWEKTAAIESALDRLLASADNNVRLSILRQMQREQIPVRLETLANWLPVDRSAEGVAAILQSLAAEPTDARRDLLRQIIENRKLDVANRRRALEMFAAESKPSETPAFLDLARSLEDGEVLAALLAHAPDHPAMTPAIITRLKSPQANVRAAAAAALAKFESRAFGKYLVPLLSDPDASVRRAAVLAVGPLKLPESVEPLLSLAVDPDVQIRAASIEALTALRETRVVPLAEKALADPLTQAAALASLAELGRPSEAPAVIKLAQSELPESLSIAAARALARWRHQADVAEDLQKQIQSALLDLQGRSGLVVAWQSSGRQSGASLANVRQNIIGSPPGKENSYSPLWLPVSDVGNDAKVTLAADPRAESVYLAFADVMLPAETSAQFLASASGTFQVWLNGKSAYERTEAGRFQAESDRFDATLVKGLNRIVVQVSSAGAPAEFHLRFRRKSSTAQLEQLTQAALSRSGDVQRGRKLFLDAAKTQCVKCHRIGSDGERIGPELTGLGDRFSRIHIVESILDPSRTVTPGFQTLLVRLSDGQTISGIKIAEDEKLLTLADQKGEKHALVKADIDQQQPQAKSTMPDNLAQQFTADQFVDLITFLVSQKQSRAAWPIPTGP